ncbi:DegQ family serine endoprotease [Futiania mangrovi]|uniref:Probable periplasmic serine endoprotease DegP-like n=1 Tax=Futiania mangrovi TaxID=2959716 RepID=A0A9J6PAD8_9PROT|nr:DegQ family serine endoprotease [Futiania mangrovii]MCP1334982.1 DegQ family serine endoprotease [Futiania mangrovii]
MITGRFFKAVRGAGLGLALIGAAAVAAGTVHPVYAQRGVPESFADLAEQLSPAVVNIATSQTVQSQRPDIPMPQFPPGTPFEEFFKDFFDRQQRGNGQPRRVQSLGSGFVIDASGYIVTNNHVIEGADEIEVNFADGRTLPAELVGTDPKTDLALLKVEPEEPLVSVSFGDSDASRVGEWVMAIGNPFGLGGSVSVGIISARNRDINAGPYDDFIQTDAAINRGNSGGPLFNMNGEVIGVNTAIISPSGGSIGIGFAIPSSIAQSVVSQLREFGETRRGWLGVRIQSVTDEIAESLGLDRARGALVAGVSDGGPAAEGGIEPGDVIVSFDGKDVLEMRQLPRIVAETQVGKTVDVDVIRQGETRTLQVRVGRLEEAEEPAAAAAGSEVPSAEQTVSALGLTLSPLTEEARTQFSVPVEVTGVLVSEVAGDSAAAEKGIRPGDVIVEVAQQEVSSPADVARLVEETKAGERKSILLLLNRGGDLRFVAVRLDK